jgi:hypothetical protein
MVFGAFIFWLISALGAFWVVNTMATRSRLRNVRANGEETFARLVSSRSRGLAEGTRVPILYLPDRPQVVADSRYVSSSVIPSVIAVVLFAGLGFLVFFRH